MTLAIICFILFFSLLLVGNIFSSRSNKKAIKKIESSFNDGFIDENQKNILINKTKNDANFSVNIEEHINNLRKENALKKQREEEKEKFIQQLIKKYGEEITNRLVNSDYWIGMNVEQLIICKGQPTKIEKEVLKTKTKETYIYGNKSSGDYFIVEDGLVVKIMDR